MTKIKQKITPFLWFENNAKEAAEFYCSIFHDSRILSVNPMVVTFELEGQRLMALNGGPQFKFTEAFSLYVECESQEEVNDFWNKLTDQGQESQCGWLKDKYGLSWQIIPSLLGKLIGDPDTEKSQRVIQAMLKMKRIDMKMLQQAYDGEPAVSDN